MRDYLVDLVRHFEASALVTPTASELRRGEADGLAGNQQYSDLQGMGWEEVADAVGREAVLFDRFEGAADIENEAERFDEERLEALDDAEALWGLDLGVAGATLALSALGAIPVSSCNAGGFGGHHTARFPHVAFYIGRASPAAILAIADAADVGLDVVDPGLGRLFGRADFDLHRFAEIALHRAKSR
jgi:hypothetical protein